MKSKEEIEQLAENQIPYSGDIKFAEITQTKRVFYGKGYTQCQEDMFQELEMHILVNEHDWTRNPQAQLKDFINSLNKQD